MKNKNRIIASILVLTLGASLLTACDNKKASSGEVKEQEKRNIKTEIASSEYDLIASGESDYFILLPEKATKKEQTAADELQLFFKQATGKELEIQKEKSAKTDGRFLSVGATKAAEKAGVAPTYDEVKNSGFVIRTIEDDCYIKGASDIGTRNGVYEWLYYCFDYECYAVDEIVLTETKDFKLPAFDMTYAPSFDLREAPSEVTWNDELAYRMKFNPNAEMFVTGRSCHTSYTLINPFVYDYTSEKYKDWYSDAMFDNVHLKATVPAQLCYSNTEWWDEYVKNLKELLKASDAPIMVMGMEDYNSEWCECKKCAASSEKYGTDVAVMIPFANYVQEKINEWYEKEYPDKEPAKLVIFAYRTCEKAPAEWDEATKTYVPMDESVKLHEDLGVYFAPVQASYAYSFNAKVNESVKTNLEAWSALTNNLYAWTYSYYPLNFMMMADSFEVMQENYQLLIENGTVSILDQLDTQKNGNSGWTRAKQYVMSKLMWDVELNMEELLDEFFAHYFDVASETMRDLFETDRQWMRHIYGDLGSNGSIFEDMLKTEYYSYPVLKKAMDGIEKAYDEIEVYRESDPERYKQLYDRITLESLQYRYIIISLYGTEYTANDLLNMKYQFKHDVERLEVTTYQEGKYITELWAAWGI